MTNGYRNRVLVGIITKMNKEKEKGKMLNVIIKDVTFEQNYYLRLSEEQYRLLEWLGEKEMLPDIKIEVFEEYEFEEI